MLSKMEIKKNLVINNLVFSGGSIKGVAFCGALEYLESIGTSIDMTNIQNICGVSVGSIIGLMYNLGFTANELKEIIMNQEFSKLSDIRILSFMDRFGIDSGNNIMEWVKNTMEKKCNINITFLELFKKTNIKLQIGATNLSRQEFRIFDYTTHPEMNVLSAIRMSTSIPIYYKYTTFKDDIYVDGAILNNFPIELYSDSPDNTIGFQLISGIKTVSAVPTLSTFIRMVIKCIKIPRDDKYDTSNMHVIQIKSELNPLDINLSKQQKLDLMELGYNCAKNKLLEKFRQNPDGIL